MRNGTFYLTHPVYNYMNCNVSYGLSNEIRQPISRALMTIMTMTSVMMTIRYSLSDIRREMRKFLQHVILLCHNIDNIGSTLPRPHKVIQKLRTILSYNKLCRLGLSLNIIRVVFLWLIYPVPISRLSLGSRLST